MSDKKYIILTIILLGAVFLSSFIGLQKTRTYKALLTANSNEPDAFMDNIVAKRMGPDGKLVNELHSPRLDHYAKNNTTHLITPSLIVYSKHEGEKPWHITALHGRAYEGSEWIVLWNQVKGFRPAGTRAAITFLTEAATVYPHRKYAQTDLPIKTIQGGLEVNGVGMRADLAEDYIELLSKVKSVYVPAPKA